MLFDRQGEAWVLMLVGLRLEGFLTGSGLSWIWFRQVLAYAGFVSFGFGYELG